MRILMLTCNNSLMDGINRHILTIATALNKRENVEVAVCSTFAKGELHEELEKVGVKTFSLDCPHGHAIPALWRFWIVMRAFKPDVVHGHVTSFFVGLVLSFCFGKVKYVTTTHGISDARSKRDELFSFLSPRTDFRCYISKGVRDALMGNVKDSDIVYNPVDVVQGNGDKVHPMTIGTACRIADVKQPLVFTDVMIGVLKQVPECRAIVCGDDGGNGYLDKMRKMIATAGVGDRFQLLGYRPDAPQIMRNISCFILTSHREGMPTAILEAMSADVPVAFMKGEGGLVDLAEMNDPKSPYAIVVDKDDVDGMVRQIVSLLHNPSQADSMTREARKLMAEHFTIDASVKKLCEIYNYAYRGGGMMCRHRNFAVSYNPIGFVSKIKELVKEADAEERLHLLGYCADAAVLMRDLDCFVMTSHWEGLPTTLLESMNAGTPIAFMKGEGSLVDLWDLNRQGIPFAITSKKGDVQDLASHICSLLTNHEMAERQIRRSREVLRECFSVDSVAAQLTDIYQSLVLEKVS